MKPNLMNQKTKLTQIPIKVNFSRESPHRPGLVSFSEQGDTVVITQTLSRTEQWEDDLVQRVYVPRGLLEALFANGASS